MKLILDGTAAVGHEFIVQTLRDENSRKK